MGGMRWINWRHGVNWRLAENVSVNVKGAAAIDEDDEAQQPGFPVEAVEGVAVSFDEYHDMVFYL